MILWNHSNVSDPNLIWLLFASSNNILSKWISYLISQIWWIRFWSSFISSLINFWAYMKNHIEKKIWKKKYSRHDLENLKCVKVRAKWKIESQLIFRIRIMLEKNTEMVNVRVALTPILPISSNFAYTFETSAIFCNHL